MANTNAEDIDLEALKMAQDKMNGKESNTDEVRGVVGRCSRLSFLPSHLPCLPPKRD